MVTESIPERFAKEIVPIARNTGLSECQTGSIMLAGLWALHDASRQTKLGIDTDWLRTLILEISDIVGADCTWNTLAKDR
jgi:hypothetical protein